VPASNPSIDDIDRRSEAPNRANISAVNDDLTDDEPATDDETDDTVDDATDATDESDEVSEEGDDEELEAGETLVIEDDDHITYDVSEWAGASRTMLDALLVGDDIPHFWQGTELYVKNEFERRVDELIDEVLDSASPALEPGRDKVVYEVASWSAALQSGIAESLGVADIAYEWSESGDLLVYADDEERVDAILDSMPDPDDAELSDADGLAVQDILSKMFLATGTLRRSPTDSDAVIDAVDAANRLERLSVPFGFEPPVWRGIVDDALALRELLEGDRGSDVTDDAVKEQAASIRAQLRHYV
jgi:hypothetical protein